MTESEGNDTTLRMARTPNIDRVMRLGSSGFYMPTIASYDTEPRTDIVIPAFFGLDAEANPGRAAMELVDLGYDLKPDRDAFFITVATHTGRAEELIELVGTQADEDVARFATEAGALCVHSAAFNYGARWIIGNCPPAGTLGLIRKIQRRFPEEYVKVENLLRIGSDWLSARGTQHDTAFLGWAKGSLRGAFKLLGAKCNPFNRQQNVYLDFEALTRDLQGNVLPWISDLRPSTSTLVMYTKETAFASRRCDQAGKIAAVEFMDQTLGKVLRAFNREIVVLVASDHSSDIGKTDNPPGRTSYVLARVGRDSWRTSESGKKFWEGSVDQICGSIAISQADLVSRIRSLCADT